MIHARTEPIFCHRAKFPAPKFQPCSTRTRVARTVLEKRTVNPGTGKFSLPVPVKLTGVQFVLVLPQTEKS